MSCLGHHTLFGRPPTSEAPGSAYDSRMGAEHILGACEVRVETATGTMLMLVVTTSVDSIHMSAEHTTLVGTLAGDTLHIPARRDKQPLEDTSTA
jgi:hypothetical protein